MAEGFVIVGVTVKVLEFLEGFILAGVPITGVFYCRGIPFVVAVFCSDVYPLCLPLLWTLSSVLYLTIVRLILRGKY